MSNLAPASPPTAAHGAGARPLEDIGSELELPRERIRQIERQAFQRLRRVRRLVDLYDVVRDEDATVVTRN